MVRDDAVRRDFSEDRKARAEDDPRDERHPRPRRTARLDEQGQRRCHQRQDDRDEEVLRKRMEIYENETVPVLKYYDEELISHFNAEQRPLEVLRDILVSLCELLS